MLRKLFVSGIMLVLLLSNTALSFAATFHIQTTGGSNIENVATVSDDYIGKLTSIQNSDFDTTNVTYSGTGWQDGGVCTNVVETTNPWENAFYKLTTGSTTENAKVKYPKYLKVGSKEYDVVLEVTGTESEATQASYVVHTKNPAMRVNFLVEGKYERQKSEADTEIAWKVTIYDAGTNNVANIKNLHMRIQDLDATTYNAGGTSNEAMKINNFTANKNNTFIKSNVSGRAKYNNGTFYGIDESDEDINVFAKVGTTISGYYGYHLNGSSVNLPMFGMNVRFFVLKHNVNYKTDGKGTVSLASEKKFADENPTGSVDTPNSGYYLDYWTVDKAVTLKDGTEIPAGNRITEAQIKNVLVNEDLTFTAHHAPYLKVTYEWNGPHPTKTVPNGKNDIKKGDSYTTDTTYKPGDTVEEPKDGAPGVWTFDGWDKSAKFDVNENTVIKGIWRFTPYYNVTYEWVGPHPDKVVPEGQSEILSGSPYNVDTTYKQGQTVKGTKDGQKGTWTFEGWDKNGTLEITKDTVIKGTWSFIPEYDITTNAVNGTITKTEKDIPNVKNPVPAIEKSVDKEKVSVGDTVTYTIKASVENGPVKNAVITDVLPDGIEVDAGSISASVGKAQISGNKIVVTISELDSATITYKAKVTKEGSHKNIATLTADNITPVSDDATIAATTPEKTTQETKKDDSKETRANYKTGDFLPYIMIGSLVVLAGAIVLVVRKQHRSE